LDDGQLYDPRQIAHLGVRSTAMVLYVTSVLMDSLSGALAINTAGLMTPTGEHRW
jgi:hypothetical protein